ncbi:MAG TPA: S-layer homology domain-containing protein [Anaerovoracaceae bacterium]|nr:S-layer homology domain-containing protein [Anaerovoracaceae bacterium]
MSLKRKIGQRILALALSLTLVLSLPFFLPFESYGASRFKDVSGHWAESFITRAYDLNVVNGYPDERFYPDKSVTRAEFVSMINNAFKINIDYGATNFTDVAYDKWYYKAVSTAVTATYAGGFSDNTFRPNTAITRQEAAVMLSNIMPNYKEKGGLKSYRDYKLIASWASAALEKMIGRQYFGPYDDGKLHPTDPLTRAQAAKILCDILNNETIITRRTTVDEDKTELSERIYTDDVTIDEDLEEGSVTIDNCVILGRLIVEGGGSGSVTINNSRVASAVADKADSAVRVEAKGSTVIYKMSASRKSILQTTGKDGVGILDLTVKKGADVTLKGNFPLVTIEGSSAVLALDSGKIANLTVTGRYSDITLASKAQVLEATVNVECYFHGSGVIAQMFINADDVTYETKPKKMTVATRIDRAVEEGGDNVDVSFRPRNKAEDVSVSTEITLTFTSSMKLADGKAITNSNIRNFISLKQNTKSGADLDFTASINSAKKIITITPTAKLITGTRYYVVLKDEALVNAGDKKNDGTSSYFTTRGDPPDTTPGGIYTVIPDTRAIARMDSN